MIIRFRNWLSVLLVPQKYPSRRHERYYREQEKHHVR